MDVDKWQKRLEDNFTEYGVIGSHLLEIIDMEKAYGQYYASTFHGQSVLMDSFQSFYIETIRSAQGWVVNNGWPENAPCYAPILFFYVTIFRSFRACQNLLVSGYPFDGYALLRDVKDRAILLCGIAHNLTSFQAIHALRKGDRKREERKVFDRIIGKDSGLSVGDLREIALWERLFHDEVHGSKLTFFTEMGDWIRGERPLSIGPTPLEQPIAMYMNRAVETGWLVTRLFPYLQAAECAFGARWEERRAILDDSFRVSEQGLAGLGKKVADALIVLADRKFSFPDSFHYFEADGSATG